MQDSPTSARPRANWSRQLGRDSPTGTIYALADPRTPHEYRYVGRTTWVVDARVTAHMSSALSRKADGSWRCSVTHKIAWLRSLADSGLYPHVSVLAVVPRAMRIFAEQQWICALLEAGYALTNATRGGEGPETYNTTEATRRRHSEGNRRRFANNPAEREFFSRLMRERCEKPEWTQMLSESSTRQWSQPGAREAQSRRLAAATGTPEARRRRSEQARKNWENPAFRAAGSERFRGEANPCARLTMAAAREIRARYAAGGEMYTEIAPDYGVSPSLIGMIVRGVIWREDDMQVPSGPRARDWEGTGIAKISRAEASEIKLRYEAGLTGSGQRETLKSLSLAYGVSRTQVARIVKGRSWAA